MDGREVGRWATQGAGPPSALAPSMAPSMAPSTVVAKGGTSTPGALAAAASDDSTVAARPTLHAHATAVSVAVDDAVVAVGQGITRTPPPWRRSGLAVAEETSAMARLRTMTESPPHDDDGGGGSGRPS